MAFSIWEMAISNNDASNIYSRTVQNTTENTSILELMIETEGILLVTWQWPNLTVSVQM